MPVKYSKLSKVKQSGRNRKAIYSMGKSIVSLRRTGRLGYLNFNPSPVFTESYALQNGDVPYSMNPNSGGVLAVNINQIPQLPQYSNLYQKYRILKAQFICIPQWNTMASDVQQPATTLTVGLSRIVYAVNNTPAIVAPANENVVLQDNGCKILCGKPKIVMSCKPVPNTLDVNNIRTTLRNNYINFTPNAIDNAPHYGISWYHTQPGTAQPTGNGVPYVVYVKLTFQLSDPR